MAKPSRSSSVVTIRVPKDVNRRLVREARRQRRTRSEVARALLEAALAGADATDPRLEARRQSELANASGAEAEVFAFITDSADLRGWK